MKDFSEYIVYVDESGNHGLDSSDPNYPVFVLAFCVFRKSVYINQTVPTLQSFKFRWFGHDGIVLHERELRKQLGPFSILVDPDIREPFLEELTEILDTQSFEVVASIIDKDRLRKTVKDPENPYHLAMGFCLERLYRLLERDEALESSTHVVFESRGKREDEELELEFRRICDGRNMIGHGFPFEIEMANKKVNSSGLQIADLVARPIGLSELRPGQSNRAYEIIKAKFFRDADGNLDDCGRKVFP